jgi:hypothetical protein
MPRIVIIPSPAFNLASVEEAGRVIEAHLDIIIAVDDEWRDLIPAYDDADLILKLKTHIIDAIFGCVTGIGNTCPAVVLHRSDIALLHLADDGTVRLLSVKEMVKRKELLYATTVEPVENSKLLRLQTYKPLEHVCFFNDQFGILELEVYERLYDSRRDVERWRRLTRAITLPAIARAVAEATRRYVMELCIFNEYNVCPGILLTSHEGRTNVKILRITGKPENGYIAQIDLAGLLANR